MEYFKKIRIIPNNENRLNMNVQMSQADKLLQIMDSTLSSTRIN